MPNTPFDLHTPIEFNESAARAFFDRLLNDPAFAGEFAAEQYDVDIAEFAPADPGREDDCYRLVDIAQTVGLITGTGLQVNTYLFNGLAFEYVDDSDGGYYFLRLDAGPTLRLASTCTEMRKVPGYAEAAGMDAVIALLADAAATADGLRRQLLAYTRNVA